MRTRPVARGAADLPWLTSPSPGVGVPMCLISAENVVKRLRDDRSPGPLPQLWQQR